MPTQYVGPALFWVTAGFFLHFLFKCSERGAIYAFSIENTEKREEKTGPTRVLPPSGSPARPPKYPDVTNSREIAPAVVAMPDFVTFCGPWDFCQKNMP